MAENFIGLLFNSRNQAHRFHLTTNSYGRLKNIKTPQSTPKSAREYFKNLLKRVNSLKLPNDPDLKNIKEEIVALIKSTLYMLTLK